MALTTCSGCGGSVSTEAAACPKCGHQFRSPGGIDTSDPVHLIGLFGVVAFVFAIGVLIFVAVQ